MSSLIQYNSSEHIIGEKNIVEAISTNGDVVFNESYVVVGKEFSADSIHATYDLVVCGNIFARNISINGSLTINGDCKADSLVCHGNLTCTGEIRVKDLAVDGFTIANSVVCDRITTNDSIFARTSIDSSEKLDVYGLIAAGEGITGGGTFSATAAIANDYFRFDGDINSSAFEISSMDFINIVESPQKEASLDGVDIAEALDVFTASLNKSLKEWSLLEEESFIDEIRETTAILPELHSATHIIDNVVELSYQHEIDNLRDYLYVLWAKNIFPQELREYETLAPVLNDMLEAATKKLPTMEYSAKNIDEFACSLYVLNKYQDQLTVEADELADRIFSSIGLRFSTVKNVWRKNNG